MFRQLIDTVYLRLAEQLSKDLGLEMSLQYSTKWHSGVDSLDVSHATMPELFREVLLITQKTSREFVVDLHTRRALQKIILESFLGGKNDHPVEGTVKSAPKPSIGPV